jgi:hypothetical protein
VAQRLERVAFTENARDWAVTVGLPKAFASVVAGLRGRAFGAIGALSRRSGVWASLNINSYPRRGC